MSEKKIHIEAIEVSKGVTIVRLAGDITFETLKSAQEEFRSKAKGKDIKNIIFDLKNIKEADTSGIAALADLLKYMREHRAGNKIALINLSEQIKALLSISQTETLFAEYPSKEEAIKALE